VRALVRESGRRGAAWPAARRQRPTPLGLFAVALVGCAGEVEDVGVIARADPANPAVWIEGGTFVAGSDGDDSERDLPRASPYSRADEQAGVWTVRGFWIQQHEVTNEEYRRFDPEHGFPAGQERHPVANVTWRQALAYALSLGGRLPTEVEWEFAARGVEAREYPWGDAEPTCELAHYVDCEPRSTVPVLSRPAGVTPEGLHGLAGNVREWVMPIWFDPARHPVNRDAIKVKGGSYAHLAFFLRAASVTNDLPPAYSWDNIGFRVAWSGDSSGQLDGQRPRSEAARPGR
jgi:formylglycine-generating enzyme required for sulfatase activity